MSVDATAGGLADGISDEPDGGVDVTGGAVAEDLYHTLRRSILECEIAPGSVLSQVQLARQFGISRTPLREVLRLLERERLVESERNRRVRITGFSVTDLEEVYAARVALEPLAARIGLATMTAERRELLGQRLLDMEECAGRDDFGNWQIAHRRFHDLLTSPSTQRLNDTLGQLTDHADRYRRIYSTVGRMAWATGLRLHKELLDYVDKREPDAFSYALAKHIAQAGLMTIAAADPTYDAALLREALRLAVRGEGLQAS